ncbi:MAG: RING finger protein [Huintestinicola sp.]
MFDYTGYTCKICSRDFTSDDDIVVCPRCGTPYHRECYKQEGKCVNDELHASGKSWQEQREADEMKEAETAKVKCTTCGNELRPDQMFCDKCGSVTAYFIKTKAENGEIPPSGIYMGSLRDDDSRNSEAMKRMNPYFVNFSDPLCGFNPDEEYDEGLTLRDVGDYVNKNTFYFLPKFKAMKETGMKFGMNISALFFPQYYFAYRKMPLISLLVLILKTAAEIPYNIAAWQSMKMTDITAMLTGFPQESIDSVQPLLDFYGQIIEKASAFNVNAGAFQAANMLSATARMVIFIICGIFANFIYYRHTLKHAKKIKASLSDHPEILRSRLRSSGGTSIGYLILFIILSFIMEYLSLGILLML